MRSIVAMEDSSKKVKVSVITVVFNAVNKIEDTIKSVLRQEYDNLEYIIIDGGSTDGTLDVIKRYRDKISVVISERDNGIYDAFNKGIKISTGEWIGIMNAGDAFASNDVLARIFVDGDGYDSDVIYGDAIAVDDGIESYAESADSVCDFDKGPVYRQGASFVRRLVHNKYLFDLSKKNQLEFALDYEQMYRMYRGGVSFRKVPFAVLKYELRGVSTVSPFKITYYNYLITHGMKCGLLMKLVLAWLTLWRGGLIVVRRILCRRGV